MTRLFAGTAFDIPPVCEGCGQAESDCVCSRAEKSERESQLKREQARIAPGKQRARIRLQKRKGGRVVTVVEGLTAIANDLPSLLAQLQSACGSGGTVKSKEDLLELQGDHVDRVRDSLRQIGYRV